MGRGTPTRLRPKSSFDGMAQRSAWLPICVQTLKIKLKESKVPKARTVK